MMRLGWLLVGTILCSALACGLNPQPLPPQEEGAPDAASADGAAVFANDSGGADSSAPEDASMEAGDAGGRGDGGERDADSDGG